MAHKTPRKHAEPFIVQTLYSHLNETSSQTMSFGDFIVTFLCESFVFVFTSLDPIIFQIFYDPDGISFTLTIYLGRFRVFMSKSRLDCSSVLQDSCVED